MNFAIDNALLDDIQTTYEADDEQDFQDFEDVQLLENLLDIFVFQDLN